jgi:VWFA-related protein
MRSPFSLSLTVLLASTLLQAQTTTPQNPPPPSPPPATQQPSQNPAAQREEEDDVVRITTNLVQFDAVVTDKKGRQVTDLTAGDFEILADGRPQQITNFSYVANVGEAAPESPVAARPADKSALPEPPTRLRPEQVRRTIVFVINDLQMSWDSVYYARRALKKFVDEQMQPGDFVAIIPTSGGSGALQQFTSDRTLLSAAVNNLRWSPQWDAGITAFERIGEQYSDSKGEGERLFDSMRRERFTVGTLNALDSVIRVLGELPGRKSLVLLSDGIPMPPPEEDGGRVMAGINRVIETANRASAVIYTVDARGLQTLSPFDASNDLSGSTPEQLSAIHMSRGVELFDSQIGMKALAEETGGVSFRNSNDIGGGIRRALEDQKGYYLIGYRPEEGTFDPQTGRARFHKFALKVKRPGLKVRTRSGFFGFTGKGLLAAVPPARTRAQQIRAALVSPFPAGGVRLRLTSLFGNDRKQGPFMRSLLHIDGRDLTFNAEPDGWHKSVLDVVALTFGANGLPVGETNMTHTVRVKGDTYQKILQAGLVYSMVVPTKKPGGYQLRVAVRDAASERVGSASQFIEVPDLKKGRIVLSGIVMTNRPAAPATTSPSKQDGAAESASVAPDPQGGPALRRFRRGAFVDYGFNIYNAKLDRATGRGRLQTQLRLFRDGKPVFTGQVMPFDAQPVNVEGDIGAGAGLFLGTELAPGEYVLQMIVTDLLAKEKQRVATQWIDFEIVN